MKIACFELEKWQQDEIKKRFPTHNFIFFKSKLSNSSIKKINNVEGLVVFIFSKLNQSILGKLPKLKFICTMSTGFDHIDIEECKKRKIKVFNVPFYGENTVAEHTFALILSLSRKIIDSVEHTRRGKFDTNGFRGFDLKGKTLGVIGTGHIGLHVIRMAKGFEMNVIAFDVTKDTKSAKRFGFKYVTWDNLLKNSDVITLHAPYNKNTHHLINLTSINKMKKGVYLVNTSRGGLIDNTALLKGLKKGTISGAGLDVLEEEGYIKEETELLSKNVKADLMTVLENHMLLDNPKVIITPHNAFNSREALTRILDTTLENINAGIKNKKINVVS